MNRYDELEQYCGFVRRTIEEADRPGCALASNAWREVVTELLGGAPPPVGSIPTTLSIIADRTVTRIGERAETDEKANQAIPILKAAVDSALRRYRENNPKS